jgi:hypothetical protein
MYIQNRKIALSIVIFILFLCIQSTFAQDIFWWTFGVGGSSDDAFGYTVGQTTISNYPVDGLDEENGYWFLDWELAICYKPNAADSISWFVRDLDTLSYNEIVQMSPGDRISVYNCGNCYIDFGLRVVGCTPAGWVCSYTNGDDRYILRSQFTYGDSLTEAFDPFYDYLKDYWTWSNGEVFGSKGWNVPPYKEVFLWFEFTSPIKSTVGGRQLILVQLSGKLNLP